MGEISPRIFEKIGIRIEHQAPADARLAHMHQMERNQEGGAHFYANPVIDPLDKGSMAAARHHLEEIRKGLEAEKRGVTAKRTLVWGPLRVPLGREPISVHPDDLPDTSENLVTVSHLKEQNR